MTVQSKFTIRNPASRARWCAWRRKRMLSAPFQRGSESGKCMPMSPSAAAPSNASVIACASTSASEWPSRPNSQGIATPPRISGRPGAMRWMSQPWPVRYSPKARFFLGEKPRQLHVAGLGDLDVAVATEHHAHLDLFHALDQARFVRPHEFVGARRLKCAPQQVIAEYLRRLRQ